jgi:peptide/nickel transport system substrate-binding protein
MFNRSRVSAHRPDIAWARHQEGRPRLIRWRMLGLGLGVSLAAVLALAGAGRAAELRIGASQLPPTLGNPFTSVGLPASELSGAVFDALTQLAPDGSLQPALALSWRAETPTRWLFTLRRDAVFQNGRPVTAEAVAASLNLLKAPAAAQYIVAGEMRNVAAIAVRDAQTVAIETREPDAILPKRLNVVWIVDPVAWGELGAERFATAPVGSGPFKVVDWGKDKGFATFAAHAGSWRRPKSVDRMIYRAVLDTTARLQALLSDRVDLVTGLSDDDVAALKGGPFRTVLTQTPNVMSITLPNMLPGDSPLKKAAVRLALNYAVDRASIAREILGGVTVAASQGAVPGVFGYNPALAPYPYDPGKARAMLAEAGYPRGFALAIGVLTNLTSADALIYQKVAQDLAAVGVRVDLRPLTFADFVRRYSSGNWGDMNAFSLIWNNAPFNDAIRPLEYFSCLKVNPFFCDEAVTRDIAGSTREMDAAAREKRLQAIMARMHDLAPAIWLTNQTTITAMNTRVKRFVARQAGIAFEEIEVGE